MATKDNIVIENAEIAFRNFSGKEGQFNREGDRNFCVLLSDKIADALQQDGWNVKLLKARDDSEADCPYLQVKVKFDERFPMNVVIVSSQGKTKLDETSINALDWADLSEVDMVIRPYDWEMNGKSGRTAYLKTMYATIVEDELMKKYANTPDSAESAIGGCGNCEECDGSCHENR